MIAYVADQMSITARSIMEVNNLMDFSMIISLLGGVACFLFGMSVMGDSLKKVAGSKM